MPRMGFRGTYYEATFTFKHVANSEPAFLARYQDLGNYIAVGIDDDDDATIWRCHNSDGPVVVATGSTYALSADTVYYCKITVDENAGAQRLRFWIGPSTPNTLVLTDTTKIDEDWDGGQVGFWRGIGAGSTAIEYDTLVVKIDGTTTAMTGLLDDTIVNDDFADSVLSLAQDDNGNLTSDGLYDYEFDAWNRLVEVQYADGTDIAFATYTYDGVNRRIIKDVNYNAGVGIVHRSEHDEGGEVVERYDYDAYGDVRWRRRSRSLVGRGRPTLHGLTDAGGLWGGMAASAVFRRLESTAHRAVPPGGSETGANRSFQGSA